jgi:hypothetical protein
MNLIGYGWDRGYLEWDRGQYDGNEEVLGGSGCALMLSAAMVRTVGGFDPAYFLYYEDLDLCLRSWRAGFRVRYVPEAVAFHAMKVSARPALYADYLDHRNRLRMVLKSLPGPLLTRTLAHSASFDARSVVAALRDGRALQVVRRLAAWGWNLTHLASTLRLRRRVLGNGRGDERWTALLAAGTGSPRTRAPVPTYRESYESTLEASRLSPELRMGSSEGDGLGLGWHALEESEGVCYRWSCGYGIAFLRTDRPGPAELRIRCRALRETMVRIAVDRRPQGEMAVAPGPWHEQGYPVRCERSVTRIDLFPDPVVVPSEETPGSRDQRTLGLSVASLRLL